MKGYFSSLAKQSGLRVSGQKTGARVSSGAADSSFPAPLHRDETVFAPPAREGRRTESAPGPEPRQTVKSAEKAKTPWHEKPVAVNIETAPGEKKTESVREVRTVEPARTETIFIEAPKPPAAAEETRPAGFENIAPAPREEISGPAVEEKKFVEREVNIAGPAEAPGGPQPQTTPGPIEQTRFFVKTAEIIEKGEIGSEDIGSILFQEVRQWVAGGPPEPDAPAPSPAVSETLTVRAIPGKEAEPGTVVIRERIDQETSGGPAALEEQNFNLSIGTISVIIEDPEKPAEPVRVIQNESSQNASPGTKREFSRFSRNYL